MGLIDGIRDLLGFGAESAAQRSADPEDLFGMSTAYVTMAADLDLAPIEEAALCFGSVDSTDFERAVSEVDALVEAGDEGTLARVVADDHGYRWVVLRDPDFEDLVVGVHAAADEFAAKGYGARLLAAVFGFDRTVRDGWDRRTERVYWVYTFRRGSFYPFVPTGTDDRDHGLEFKLRAVLEGELDVEPDEAYWYPLWPDAPGEDPWPSATG